MDETAASERWLTLAQEAVQYYGMPDAQVNWLAHTNNAVFDVRHGDEHYVMRLSRHSDNSQDRLQGELMCLTAIQKSSHLIVPQLIEIATAPEDIFKASGGTWEYLSGILSRENPDPEQRTHCVLFRYIEGETRHAAHLTTLDVKRVGKFLAQLHTISANSPDAIEPGSIRFAGSFRPRLDYEGLFGRNSRYYPGEAAALFTNEQKQVMQAAQANVKAAMDEIGMDKANFGIVHGDMLLPNILFHEGDVRAIDFEYCGLGYYLYDLTPLLWHLKPEERYQALEDALWEGYTAVRPLPRRELLETFIGARHIASMLWTAINQHHPFVAGKAREILQQRTEELRGLLETGHLQRHYD